jgi:hypothetical protein
MCHLIRPLSVASVLAFFDRPSRVKMRPASTSFTYKSQSAEIVSAWRFDRLTATGSSPMTTVPSRRFASSRALSGVHGAPCWPMSDRVFAHGDKSLSISGMSTIYQRCAVFFRQRISPDPPLRSHLEAVDRLRSLVEALY